MLCGNFSAVTLAEDCAERPAAVDPRALERAHGSLELEIGWRDGRSALRLHRERGCAKARFPRPAVPQVFEAVLINTAGGMTAGDRIEQRVRVHEAGSLIVSGQAAEKVYRCKGADAEVLTSLWVDNGASLFWLPQETILFDGARLVRRTEVDLGEKARLLLVEAAVLGRTARGEELRFGRLVDQRVLRRSGNFLLVDPFRIEGPIGRLAERPALLGGARAFATILAVGPELDAAACEAVRAALAVVPVRAACGLRGPLLLCRLLASDGFELRRGLLPALEILLRRMGVMPGLPRVWTC